MLTSQNRHQPKWLPWFLWLLWNPVDAVGCRNEHTGVTDHSKVTTVLFLAVALVLHAVHNALAWWELIILGTLCFGSLVLFTTLLKSGIFSGRFTESTSTVTEHRDETLTVREARDPAEGVDPA